jgi:hypothetical protein
MSLDPVIVTRKDLKNLKILASDRNVDARKFDD